MKKTIIPILLGIWSTQSHAIVNVEDMRISSPEPGFSGNIGLSISGKSGNTEKDEFSLDSRLQWQQDSTTDFIVLSYDYSETTDVRNTNKSFIHGRHVWQYSPRRAWEAFVQFESNEFARLSYRGLIGTGLRFTLAEQEDRIGLYFGAGAFFVREILKEQVGLTDHGVEEFGRGNFYLSYKHKLSDQVSLVSTTYYQPRLDDGEDSRALEQAALAIKINDHLDFKISLDIAYDSQPPQTVEKMDTSYRTGLSYQF